MSSENDEQIERQLGPVAAEAIAQAFFDYKDKLTEILKPFTDEELQVFAGDLSAGKIREAFESRYLVPKMVAATELNFRRLEIKSKAAFDAGATWYCVFHDQDGALCDPKDHE